VPEAEKPLVAVVGPTASGKSGLALALARRFGGEIVSCDSLQVYRGFDIGTAKLPLAGREGIPHHLIDVADGHEVFTAGDFVALATGILADISRRGRLPIIAGGTGFYLRSLLEGMTEAPPRDRNLRHRLAAIEQRKPGFLRRALRRLDPPRAREIHPHDINKLMRAVEIYCVSTQPASTLKTTRRPLTGYRVLRIGLRPPRESLYQRIELRSRRMFESGLVEEVWTLLQQGLPSTAKPFESLGYKEALAVIERQLSEEDAVLQATLQTRHYVKRQLTWFRRDQEIVWFDGFGDEPAVQDHCTALLEAFLQLSH